MSVLLRDGYSGQRQSDRVGLRRVEPEPDVTQGHIDGNGVCLPEAKFYFPIRFIGLG